jgi:hypothetical protein
MSCCPIHVSLLDSLDTTYGIAALWIGLALLASVISIRIGLSVALVEILVGVVGGNLLGMTPTEWITVLAGVGSILLTFSPGPRSTRCRCDTSSPPAWSSAPSASRSPSPAPGPSRSTCSTGSSTPARSRGSRSPPPRSRWSTR